MLSVPLLASAFHRKVRCRAVGFSSQRPVEYRRRMQKLGRLVPGVSHPINVEQLG